MNKALTTIIGQISGRTFKSGDYYIARCNELPVAGFGDTSASAMQSFFTCLEAYMVANERASQLESTLMKHKALHDPSKAWIIDTKNMKQSGTFAYAPRLAKKGKTLALSSN